MDDHILYPEFKKDRVAHHPLAWNYLPPKKERSPVTINKLKPYLQNPNMNVLLSSEDFSSIQDPSKIKKDLDGLGVFNVKIIVYLRRQDDWLESAYNQRTKIGSLETLCSDYDKKRDWSLLLKRWEESFAQQNLIVKVYDRAQMPQGIIADFLDIFSLTPGKFAIPTDSNKSLDNDLLQIKRLANEIEVQVPLNKINHINDILLQNYPQKKFLFSFDERLKILKNYQKSNESVAQKYFGRENLFSEPKICKNNYSQYKGLDIEKVCVISLLFLKAHHIDTQTEHRNYHKLKKKMKRYLLRVTALILIQGAIIFYLLLMQNRQYRNEEKRMRTLYIHIGVHKTGTSTIQRLFYHNRQKFMDKGVVYPEIGNLYSHHALAWSYVGAPEGRKPVSLQEISKYLRASPDKDILLSSEALCNIDDPMKLSKDLRKFVNRPIKIIVYLRRQDYWWESIYNQKVKSKKTRLTDKFNSDCKDRGNWQLLIEKWEKAFGKHNLIVKAYGKKEMPQGLIADFLDIFSLKPQGFILPKNANESLDLDLLEIKRLANVIQWHLPLAKLEKINSVLRQRFPQKRYLLSLEERLKILELYSEGNQKVAENHLGKKQLFVDSFPHNCENYPQYKGLEIEKVVIIFLTLWKELSPKTKNFKRIRKKIKRTLLYLSIVIVLQGIFIIYLLTRQIL